MGSLLVWLNRASALDYEVSVAVMATLPPGSPVIETPDPETTFTDSDQVIVSGSCTVVIPALVVILLRDGEPIGSGVCQGDGTFHIPITMVLGENIINVMYKTITGEDGPPGTTMVLYYRPKAVPGGGSTSTGGSGGGTPGQPTADYEPLTIKTVDFVPFALNEKLILSATVRGGKPPYTLKIDWGDGSVESFVVNAAGVQELSHSYKISKSTMAVVMEATDSAGNRTQIHLAAVYKSGRQLVQAPSTTQNKPSILDHWMTIGLWLGYVGLTAVLGGFWLHARNLTPTRAAYIPAGRRRRPVSRSIRS